MKPGFGCTVLAVASSFYRITLTEAIVVIVLLRQKIEAPDTASWLPCTRVSPHAVQLSHDHPPCEYLALPLAILVANR